MKFIPWGDLKTEQSAAVATKWPEEPAPSTYEYTFLPSGDVFAKRLSVPEAKPPSVAKAGKSAEQSVPEIVADRIMQVALGQLIPSPLNPRRRYDEEALKGLAENIKALGIVHALLARPNVTLNRLEVIAGHRRLAAAKLAGIATLPVVVREISDTDALDLMLSENLQREDLNPMEEAEGLKQMLDLRDAAGAPIYTLDAVAAKLGRTVQHVGHMLRLLRLPKNARQALEDGEIGVWAGNLIAKLPTAALRQQLTNDVLKGWGEGPLSTRELKDHVRRNFVVELRNPPFNLADAKLLPETEVEGERVAGGSCKDCPHNSANMEDSDNKKGSTPLCTNPTCFADKVDANTRDVKARALAAGNIVIEGKKAKELIYHDGTPAHDSGMVAIDAQPSQSEVTSDKKPPTWKKLITGIATPQITVVFDERGKPHELVPRRLAIEAAKKNGHENLFTARANRAQSTAHADDLARKQKENDEAKLRKAIAFAALEELGSVVIAGKVAFPWGAFLETALQHAGADGEMMVIWRLGLEVKKSQHGQPDRAGAIRAHAEKLNAAEMTALCLELLLGGWMKYSNTESKPFVALAKAYGLDLGEITAKAKGELEMKGKKKKAAADAPVVAEQEPAAAGDSPAAEECSDADFEPIKQAIIAAGEKGITVKDLSESLKIPYQVIYIKLVTAGKREDSGIEKCGPAVYRAALKTEQPEPLDSRDVEWVKGMLRDGHGLSIDDVMETCGVTREVAIAIWNAAGPAPVQDKSQVDVDEVEAHQPWCDEHSAKCVHLGRDRFCAPYIEKKLKLSRELAVKVYNRWLDRQSQHQEEVRARETGMLTAEEIEKLMPWCESHKAQLDAAPEQRGGKPKLNVAYIQRSQGLGYVAACAVFDRFIDWEAEQLQKAIAALPETANGEKKKVSRKGAKSAKKGGAK